MRGYHLLTANPRLYGACHSEDGSLNTCMQVALCSKCWKIY